MCTRKALLAWAIFCSSKTQEPWRINRFTRSTKNLLSWMVETLLILLTISIVLWCQRFWECHWSPDWLIKFFVYGWYPFGILVHNTIHLYLKKKKNSDMMSKGICMLITLQIGKLACTQELFTHAELTTILIRTKEEIISLFWLNLGTEKDMSTRVFLIMIY